MTVNIPVPEIKRAVKTALAEAFDTQIGMYLDEGDTLRETLEHVNAEQASVPIYPGSNSIAGQIKHMIYYFDVTAEYMRGKQLENTNWDTAWETVAVNEDAWLELKLALWERQQELYALIESSPDETFTDPEILASTYGVVAHTAFHLGQIRHALAAQGLDDHADQQA